MTSTTRAACRTLRDHPARPAPRGSDARPAGPRLSAWASELFTDLYGDAQALAQMPLEEQSAAATIQSVLQRAGRPRRVRADGRPHRPGRRTDARARSGTPARRAVRRGCAGLAIVGGDRSGRRRRVRRRARRGQLPRSARRGRVAASSASATPASGELASYRDRLDAKHRHLLAAFDAARSGRRVIPARRPATKHRAAAEPLATPDPA